MDSGPEEPAGKAATATHLPWGGLDVFNPFKIPANQEEEEKRKKMPEDKVTASLPVTSIKCAPPPSSNPQSGSKPYPTNLQSGINPFFPLP